MRNRSIAVLLLTFFIVLFLLTDLRAEDPVKEGVLTWKNYDGLESTKGDVPFRRGDAFYIFDGKVMGQGNEGLFNALTELQKGHFNQLKVVFPKTAKATSPHFQPPYVSSPFRIVAHALDLPVEYYFHERKIDAHTFWWDIEPGDAPLIDRTTFYLDGKSIGLGQSGLDSLLSRKWGYAPILQLLFFRGKAAPYRTCRADDSFWSIDKESPLVAEDTLRKLFKNDGVRIEVYFTYPPML